MGESERSISLAMRAMGSFGFAKPLKNIKMDHWIAILVFSAGSNRWGLSQLGLCLGEKLKII